MNSTMKSLLESYERASGQSINFQKSSLTFSSNTSVDSRQYICQTFDVEVAAPHSKYLGLPSIIGRNKGEVFRYLKDQLSGRINAWSKRFLSRAGKEILLKTVAQALPNYTMNIFLLPLEVCSDVERIMNKFWWCNSSNGTGVHWKAWESLSIPKNFGGLGFRQLRDFNLALLGKQGWRLLTDETSLLSRVLKSKYFPTTNFLQAKLGTNPSFTWRSILAAQELVRRGARWRVSSGDNTLVFQDPWLPSTENPFVETLPIDELKDLRVVDLRMEFEWNYELIRELFLQRDQELIFKIPISFRRTEDSWSWQFEPRGGYSVKSAYRSLRTSLLSSSPNDDVVWKRIWTTRVPPKVQNLIWRLAAQCLPTNANLLHRRIEVNAFCSYCQSIAETDLHVFMQCNLARACWTQMGFVFPRGLFQDIQGWLLYVFNNFETGQVEHFFMICWSLWQSRNDRFWKKKPSYASTICQQAMQFLSVWKQAQRSIDVSTDVQAPTSAILNWQPPPTGWIKVNTDATVAPDINQTRTGWVACDSQRRIVAAGARCWQGCLDVAVAEALGIREALSWIKDTNQRRVLVESDAQQVVHVINEVSSLRSDLGLIVSDCKCLLNGLNSISLLWVNRSENSLAHHFVRAVSLDSGRVIWNRDLPDFVHHVLFAIINA